jgi:electron transfer flavoprotein beta subunit
MRRSARSLLLRDHMRFVALVKTASSVAVDSADALTRAGRVGPGTLGALDARAVDAAIRLRDAFGGGDVVAAAIAPADVMGAVREAIAIGADRGVVLADPLLDCADVVARGRAAAALLTHLGADVGIYAPWPSDVDGTIMWSAAGAILGWPLLAQARTLGAQDAEIVTSRQVQGGDIWMAAPPPCLIEVTEGLPAARRASLKSKQTARSKPLQLLALNAIGAEPPVPQRIASEGRRPAPGRAQPVVVTDPLVAPAAMVSFLRDKGFIA